MPLMLQITIVHRIELVTPDALQALKDQLMSALSDKIAEVQASVDAAVTRVQDDVTALHAKIDALQAQVDAGVATPADLAALDALKAKADALDPTKSDVLPTPEPEVPPNPPTA